MQKAQRDRQIGRQKKRVHAREREKERQRARETSRDIEMSDVDVDVARESQPHLNLNLIRVCKNPSILSRTKSETGRWFRPKKGKEKNNLLNYLVKNQSHLLSVPFSNL